MMHRLIISIAVIGFVQEAAGADIDTAYLRGSDVQQVGYPWYPTNAPTPSDLPIFKGPIAPAPPAWFWTGFYGGVHVGAVAGTASFADPFGSSIFGDSVTTPGFWLAAKSATIGKRRIYRGYLASKPTSTG
jgi:hypothetical protein